MHKTTQRIDGGNINSMASDANLVTHKVEFIWYRK